jgi:hypothetical protein
VMPSGCAQELWHDLTVRRANVIYRDKTYQFSRGVEALIPLITSEVEQFLIRRGASRNSCERCT